MALITDEQLDMRPPPLPSLPPSSHRPTSSSSNITATGMATSLKRLSLNFPTQPIDHSRHRLSSVISSSPDKLSSPSSPELRPSLTAEPNAFLTALATQERRVLELKEELQKAELDLDRLKKQWAGHEATRKRNEMRQVEQLRPLASPTKVGDLEAESERRASREEDRRRVLNARAKRPQRKVFEGGRHARTLSLLSSSSSGQQKAPSVLDGATQPMQNEGRRAIPTRSATVSGPTRGARALHDPSTMAGPLSKGTKDDLMNTGKQLVGDLREGLWTFIEDLRQATVGDEAVNAARPRHKRNPSLGRPSSRNSSRTRAQTTPNRGSAQARRKGDTNASPATRTKLSSNTVVDIDDGGNTKNTNHKQPAVSNGSNLDGTIESPEAETPLEDDGWDNWESPPPKNSSPTVSNSPRNSNGNASPSPAESSPRTSVSLSDATPHKALREGTPRSSMDQLPWPVLIKLSPGNLTRTASTLMREWEASLQIPAPMPADEAQKASKAD
ncbi:hypothetical protein MMC30_004045 [Trapelia coarctata]|nr:hypothetical protein [Trapelia coarctata]